MAIGASVGSVATGRTATRSKPFFSKTRREAALAAAARPARLGWLAGLFGRQALMPATGAAAVAALAAVFLLTGAPHLNTSVADNPASSFDVHGRQ